MSIAYINPHLIKVSPKIKHATIEYMQGTNLHFLESYPKLKYNLLIEIRQTVKYSTLNHVLDQ